MTALLPALAGANVIYGLGMLEMGITFDLAQLVLDNEVAAMIKYAVNGIPVNDETLAIDVIREVGIFNDFLGHDDTYYHMRSQSQAQLIDRGIREDWEKSGSTDAYQRAKEKVQHILDNYEPPPLEDSVRATIKSIIADAEDELGVSKKMRQGMYLSMEE